MTVVHSEESWVDAAQDELFRGWKRWASFTCIWAWSCLSMYFSTIGGAFDRLSALLSLPNEVVLVATAVALFAILLFSRFIPTIIRSKPCMGFAGAVLIAGSTAYVVGITFEIAESIVVGMALGGIAIAILKVAWGEMYSVMGLRRSLISISYAVIASSVLVLLAIDLPIGVLEGALLAVSIPCAPLAYAGFRELERNGADRPASQSSLKFSPALLILPLMVGLSYGLVKGILPLVAPDTGDSVRSMLLVSGGIAGIILLSFSFRLNDRFGPAQIYSVGLILVVAGLILIASRAPYLWLALAIHDVGFSIFYFFMIVHWGDLSRRTGLPIVRVYATGYFCFQGIQALTSVAVYYAASSGFFSGADILLVLSAVLAIFIASLLLFGDGRSPVRQWLVAQDPPVEKGDGISEACHSLADAHDLSPREREVLALLARGRNASYIARTLCISLDTAKSHIKSIYRKSGIHTQQELLDEIETYIPALP